MTATTRTREDSQMIATEILRQIGGRRFIAMTGAKNMLSHESGLSFRLPSRFATDGINYVKVTLTADDDYTVEFGKVWGVKYRVLATVEGVYCDNLRDVFTDKTGLECTLGTMGRN